MHLNSPVVFRAVRHGRDAEPVWKPTTELGEPQRIQKLHISAVSQSILLVLSRMDSCGHLLEIYYQFAVEPGSFDPSCSDLEFFGFHPGAAAALGTFISNVPAFKPASAREKLESAAARPSYRLVA